MRFREELPEARFFPRRPVERLHEFFPLLSMDDESCSIGERLFGLVTSGGQNEVGDVDALAPGGNLDEILLACSGADLKAPVLRLFMRRCRHEALLCFTLLYCQCTPKVKMATRAFLFSPEVGIRFTSTRTRRCSRSTGLWPPWRAPHPKRAPRLRRRASAPRRCWRSGSPAPSARACLYRRDSRPSSPG